MIVTVCYSTYMNYDMEIEIHYHPENFEVVCNLCGYLEGDHVDGECPDEGECSQA